MLIEIKAPLLSESVSEASVLVWHKQAGERVERGDNLTEIETDKVVLDIVAPAGGVLRILKQNGERVASEEPIATIDTEAKPTPAMDGGSAGNAGTVFPPAVAAKPVLSGVEGPAAAVPAKPAAPAAPATATPVEPLLSPAARKLAAERGLNPAAVTGSGRGGRVTKEDVERQAAPAAPRAKPPLPAGPTEARPEQRVPMTRLRARVAERLLQAQHQAAILTTFNEVNLQPVVDLRSRYRARFEQEHKVKLGYMSFFVKAAAAALKKFPVVNASVDGGDVVYHGYYDIGIAVSSPRGLVVPILRDADRLTFAEIELAIAEFSAQARDSKLTLEALTGGTFTITNGGIFGSLMSTPILNPPQSAILGMHKIMDRPVAENGRVVIRPMMYLALSYDHRLIDGRDAVMFLVDIKETLENPASLLLEV